MPSSCYELWAALPPADLEFWRVLVGLCPHVRHSATLPMESLRRNGMWVSGVDTALHDLGRGDHAADAAVLETTVGPRAELRWAIGEARRCGVRVCVVAFHRAPADAIR